MVLDVHDNLLYEVVNFMKRFLRIVSSLVILIFILMNVSACGNNESVVALYADGEKYDEVEVTVGHEFSFGIAQKIGYTFLGWYSNDALGTPYTDNEGYSNGMVWKKEYPLVAYAHFEANTYKISFDYQDATAQNTINDLAVVYDEKINLRLPVPLKNGYSFAGWFTNNNIQITDSNGNFLSGTDTYSNKIYPLGDEGTTLYAHWSEKKITFNFITDGSEVSSVSYTVGSTIYNLPSSIKDNYCFLGWYFDSTFLNPLVYPYTISENLGETIFLYSKFKEGTNNVLQFNTIASTNDKEYVVSYSGSDKEIVIPDSYYGKMVTRIGRISSNTVQNIILPESIKDFGTGAFKDCLELTSVNIPNGVKNLPNDVFSGDIKLSGIVFPLGLEAIGKNAFENCSSIKKIVITKGINNIGASAFKNMTSLEEFEVSLENDKYLENDGVLYYKIGNSTYLIQYPAKKNGDTYQIDESAIRISEGAFSGARINTITIGGKISSIEAFAFENCQSLINVTINSIASSFSIGEGAFSGNKNLRAMKIELDKVPTIASDSITNVSDSFSVYVTSRMLRSFQNAANWRQIADKIYSLGLIFGDYALEEYNDGYAIKQYFGTDTDVSIPKIINAKKIIKISENAFSFSNIERVTISENVAEIGDNAFYNCSSLASIILECLPPSLGDDVFSGVSDDFTIYIKNTALVLDQYKIADKWSLFADRIWSYQ